MVIFLVLEIIFGGVYFESMEEFGVNWIVVMEIIG